MVPLIINSSVTDWQNMVGKCVDIAFFDIGSGLAEVKAVDDKGIYIQWICMSPCYSCQVVDEAMYTETKYYTFDLIAKVYSAVEIPQPDIQKQRTEYMEAEISRTA